MVPPLRATGHRIAEAARSLPAPLLQPIGIRLARGRDLSGPLVLAPALAGLGFGLFAFASSQAVWVYVLGVAVYSAGEVANTAVASAVVAALAPPAHRGAYQGSWTMMWGLGHMAAPALSALALGAAGARALWLGCLALGLATAAAQLALSPRLGERLAAPRVGGGAAPAA